MVRFRDDDIMTDIVDRDRDKRTMLTAFFDRNKVDESARQYFNKYFRNTTPGTRARVVGILEDKDQ